MEGGGGVGILQKSGVIFLSRVRILVYLKGGSCLVMRLKLTAISKEDH